MAVINTSRSRVKHTRQVFRTKAWTPCFTGDFADADEAQGKREGIYTWGMLDVALHDLIASFPSCGSRNCEDGELASSSDTLLETIGDEFNETDFESLGEAMNIDASDPSRVAASFTGAEANTGLLNFGQNLSETVKGHILLSFSGGGSSADYSFSSDESISDDHYSLGVSMHGVSTKRLQLGARRHCWFHRRVRHGSGRRRYQGD